MTTEAAERLDGQAVMGVIDALNYISARYLGGGRPPSRNTLYVWMRDGCRSRTSGALVKLQRELVGGRVVTRKRHVDSFLAELNGPPARHASGGHQRRMTDEEARDVLRQRGIA